jgi:hypothetical protein
VKSNNISAFLSANVTSHFTTLFLLTLFLLSSTTNHSIMAIQLDTSQQKQFWPDHYVSGELAGYSGSFGPSADYCANCGRRGHRLGDCVGPVNVDGEIYGCPIHNTKLHSYDECFHCLAHTKASMKLYLYNRRSKLPALVSTHNRHWGLFESGSKLGGITASTKGRPLRGAEALSKSSGLNWRTHPYPERPNAKEGHMVPKCPCRDGSVMTYLRGKGALSEDGRSQFLVEMERKDFASRREAALQKEPPRPRDSRGVEKITSSGVDSWRPEPRPVSRGRGVHDNNRAQDHGRLSYDDYYPPAIKTEPGLQTPSMPRKIAVPTGPRGLGSRAENSKASSS